ncbi:MAG: DNA polymerase III subunit delta [Clostridiales bacterium]|nr:DNA polymerase III subunit delta [Clostridiales bacterium]
MEKEHAYQRIQRDIKNGSIKNAVLLYGKEQYLVKWSVDVIVKKYVGDGHRAFDFFQVDAENTTAAGIIDNCETFSMFSEKRVVCVTDFLPVSGGKLKSFPEQETKRLADYIKKIPDSCLLVITSKSVDKRLKLYKEMNTAGSAYDFEPLDEPALKSFIEKRFKGLGKTIKSGTLRELISCSGYYNKESGYTLYNFDNDIRKIAAHCDGGEVLPKDVHETVTGDVESGVFTLIDAIGRNDKGSAFRLLHNVLGSGGSFYYILALLVSQFEIILEIRELLDEGKLTWQIPGILGANEYRIKKAAPIAELYSKARIKDILKKVYQVEFSTKAGEIDPVLALEVLISEM